VKIRNGSIELHVAEDGDASAPPILLLHGITSFGGTWDWFVPELAERFRVLRLDFRGHGASDRAPGEYTAAGYLSDAVAAIEQVAGQPCIVIGHSLGGATAAALTQRHAELVVAAAMEDPPLGAAGNSPEREDQTLLDGFRLMRGSIPQMQAAGMTRKVLTGMLAALPGTSGSTFGAALHADGISSMAGSLLAVDAAVLDPVLDGTIGTFLDPDLAFGAPSLIVCADPDVPGAVADPALARQFAEISSDVGVRIVDGAGHLIHDELAARHIFREATIEFIDRAVAA
jgi:pimeloyl-ACP methyl ester carboxylesterase